MSTKSLYFFFLFGLIFQAKSFAQTSCDFSIKGTLIDGETNEPFEGVSVYVKELEKGALTDSKGKFEIKNICQGEIHVVYSYLGYKTYIAHYKVDETVFDKVILHTDTCLLESVTVFGKKPEELATFTKASLSGKDLDRTRGLSLGETLKEIPGVTTFRTGSSISKPVIHGLHSNRIVILNAGLRQEGQQWGNEHAPEIDPFVSDKLTVVKGAAGVRYGSDAIAGVVIVEPRALPKEKGMTGEVNLTGMSNNRQGTTAALLEGKIGNRFPLTYRIQGTYKKAGNTRTPNYYQANTGFEEKNFSYALGYDKKWFSTEVFYSQFNSDLGIFSGAHIGSLSDLKNAINRSEPAVKSDFSYEIKRPFQHVEHELVRIKLSANFASLGKLGLQLGRQFNDRSEFDVLRSSVANAQKDIPQLQFKLTTHSADLVFDHRPLGNFSGTIGTSFMRQSNIWQGRFLIPSFISNGYGFFAIEKWSKNKIELEAGIRHDAKQLDVYLNESGTIAQIPYTFSNTTGTLGMVYKLKENLSWRTNIGSTWRPPTVNELYSRGLHHGAAAIENGDAQLKPEQAYKVISSIENKSSKLATEIAVYYNQINDFIYLKPDLELVQTIRGAFPSFTYTQVNARFCGADLMADYSLRKTISLIGKGSLVFAKNQTDNDFLIYTPPIRYSGTIRYSPLEGSFCQKHKPYTSFSAFRVEKQNRVPENGDYALPPNAYTLFDAEIGADFVFGKQKVNVSLQVNNIFNTVYRDYLNRFRYYTDEMGRNISLRIKVPFVILK